MISRRGLFRLLSGAAVSPVLKPLAALFPVSGNYGPPSIIRVTHDEWGKEFRQLRIRYDPIFLCRLKANTAMETWNRNHDLHRCLPEFEGKTVQFFTYKLPEGEVETV